MAQTQKRLKQPKELGEPGIKAQARSKAKSLTDYVKGLPLARLGAVSGIGAAVVLLGAPLLPVAVAATGVGGYYVLKSRKKYSSAMTQERIKVYEHALATLKDPKKLRVLADEFEKAGCAKEAAHLRKRASLRERSPAEKKADQNRYRAAMAAVSSAKISGEADYFEELGADGAAKNLRTKADALRAVGK